MDSLPPDNTASSPHEGDGAVIQFPVQLLSSLTHEHKALSVGDNLRRVQCLKQETDNMHTNQGFKKLHSKKIIYKI